MVDFTTEHFGIFVPAIDETQTLENDHPLKKKTLWLFNLAMENCPFIDGLLWKIVIFHGDVK